MVSAYDFAVLQIADPSGQDVPGVHSGGVPRYYLAGSYEHTNARLVANMDKAASGAVLIYNIAGEAILRQVISFSQGINMIDLPLTKEHAVRVVGLLLGDRLVFSQKMMF